MTSNPICRTFPPVCELAVVYELISILSKMALDSLPFEVICLVAWSLPRTKDQLSLLCTSHRLHDTVIHAIYKQQSNYSLSETLRWLLRTGFERGLQHIISRNNLNVNYVEPDYTPLIVAIIWGHVNIVELLLRNGAHVNLGTYFPALECAAMLGNYHITNLLLQNGAHIDLIGQESGLTALACAVKLGYTSLHYSLPAGDHRWCNSSSYKDQSEFAAVIQLLLAHGADPNCKSIIHCSTPLHQIPEGPWESPEELLPLFLEFGALLDKPDRQGNTPLHVALKRRAFLNGAVAQKAWVRQLLKFGANVNAKNMHGDTPFGTSFNDPSVLELLWKPEAYGPCRAEIGTELISKLLVVPAEKQKERKKRHGINILIELLVEHGAGPDPYADGKSLLDMRVARSYPALQVLIRERRLALKPNRPAKPTRVQPLRECTKGTRGLKSEQEISRLRPRKRALA